MESEVDPVKITNPSNGRTLKTIGKLIILILSLMALALSAYAQSPREQLQAMVEQLQKKPSDSALR